jgi:glycosyltransferase involved in cell wall biosynthesis
MKQRKGKLMTDKMRISWLSNAPWAATGYGQQTALFAPRINAAGYPLAIQAFYGLEGGMINMGKIPVYPRMFHPYGQDAVAAHAAHFRADIVLSLMDAWVCTPETWPKSLRWVAWYPVDMSPLPPMVAEKVRKAYARITMSRFGEQMTADAGMDSIYVPHGVDTKAFAPMDSAEARRNLHAPADAFIVTMVAANKGNPSRKSFAKQIEAFAALKKKPSDAILYLHTAESRNGEHGGVNLPELCEHHGLKVGRTLDDGGDVFFPDQYFNLIGGFTPRELNWVYNAADVKLLASMGEGFGIPLIEAQAAGCPVITGDWTAMGELCFSGWKIDKSEAEKVWTPLASYQWDVHTAAVLDRLEAAYNLRGNVEYRERARKGAMAYDVEKVMTKYFLPALAKVQAMIKGEA